MFYTYDELNRLLTETDQQSEVTAYTYDAHGNVTSFVDRRGRLTEYTYDNLHRLTQEDWYQSIAKVSPRNNINYGYDAEGNLTSIDDWFSSYAFTYDDIYRLTQEAGTNSIQTAGTVDVTLDYTYDNASNRLTMTETTPGSSGSTGQVNNYQYDRLNRLVGMDQAGDASSGDKSIGFDYDALGLVSQIQRFNDTTKTNQVSRSDFAYDGLNRITDMDHRDSADSIIAFYDYQYDGVGNLTGQTDTDGSITFNVNARNEVTVADYGTGDVRTDESYNYDATSDLSSRNGSSFTEGDDNEVTGDGTYTYTYDDEGNLIRQDNTVDSTYRTFTYDHRNRLTSVTDYSSGGVITASVTYTYGALNRRILKDDGTTQTAYSYDGSDVQLEFVNGVLAVRYFQGLGIDDVFAEENIGLIGTAEVDWLLTDRQGTVKDILDADGDLAQHVVYDTYGNIIQVEDGTGSIQTVNDLLTEYGFTSRRYESETGLWYFRARYYNSELGRFISRDPAGFVDGASLYAGYFAAGWMVDPTGEGMREWLLTGMWNPPASVLRAAEEAFDKSTWDRTKGTMDAVGEHGTLGYYGNAGDLIGEHDFDPCERQAAKGTANTIIATAETATGAGALKTLGKHGIKKGVKKIQKELSDSFKKRGKLTKSEKAELQEIADKYDTEIHVVGSRASGRGRNINKSNYPVGKGRKTRSDIDTRIDNLHPKADDIINDVNKVGGGAGNASHYHNYNKRRSYGPVIKIKPNKKR